MKVSILTLGCKANQAESSFIEANLRSRGCTIVQLGENPDFCIINTCSVTSKSDYQSRQLIRRAHRAGSSIIVTGCYSQLNKDAVKAMDGVELITDNSDKYSIIKAITGTPSCNTLHLGSSSRSRFFLKVQDGCDHSCSYCLIPKARGRSRSISVEEVISNIDAVSGVYSEVVLTGIHLGTYGYDLMPKVKLSDLVSTILLKTTIKRIRLSSLEINEVDEGLIALIEDERVCRHLHIPLQSGDDRVLEMMNRPYSARQYLDGIQRILERAPDISLGTDIIAGFPGETEREFENTMDLIETLPFSYIHVFPFSARKGTKASEMPGAVASSAKRLRCSRARELGSRKKAEYMQRQVGKTLDVLIEERVGEGAWLGTTGNYLKALAYLDHAGPKDIAPVGIASVDGEALVAYPISPL
jgi:threonylcarbamoyladenosine tRNA methylthiotransferase MtaB